MKNKALLIAGMAAALSAQSQEEKYLITNPILDYNYPVVLSSQNKNNRLLKHSSYAQHKRDKIKRKNVQKQKNVR